MKLDRNTREGCWVYYINNLNGLSGVPRLMSSESFTFIKLKEIVEKIDDDEVKQTALENILEGSSDVNLRLAVYSVLNNLDSWREALENEGDDIVPIAKLAIEYIRNEQDEENNASNPSSEKLDWLKNEVVKLRSCQQFLLHTLLSMNVGTFSVHHDEGLKEWDKDVRARIKNDEEKML